MDTAPEYIEVDSFTSVLDDASLAEDLAHRCKMSRTPRAPVKLRLSATKITRPFAERLVRKLISDWTAPFPCYLAITGDPDVLVVIRQVMSEEENRRAMFAIVLGDTTKAPRERERRGDS